MAPLALLLALAVAPAAVFCAQIPLTDPIPDNPTKCSLITQTNLCVPWSRTFAFDGPNAPGIDSNLAIPDAFPVQVSGYTAGGATITASFDYWLMYWSTATNMTSQFNSRYSCRWHGHGLRYQLSYGCALTINSYGACNSGNGYLRGSLPAIPTGSVRPLLCQNTCFQYYHDIINIFESSMCDSVASLKAAGNTSPIKFREQDLAAIYTTCTDTSLRPTATANQTYCVEGIPTETVRCGFLNTELANLYCSQWNTGSPGVTVDSNGLPFVAGISRPTCCGSVALGPDSKIDAGLDFRSWDPAEGLPEFLNVTLLTSKAADSGLQAARPAGNVGLVGSVVQYIKSLSGGAIFAIILSVIIFIGTGVSVAFRAARGYWPAWCICCSRRKRSKGMGSSGWSDSGASLDYPSFGKRLRAMFGGSSGGYDQEPEMSEKGGVMGFFSGLVKTSTGYLSGRRMKVGGFDDPALNGGFAATVPGEMGSKQRNGSTRFNRSASGGVELDTMQDTPDGKKKIRDAWMTFDDDALGSGLNPGAKTRTAQILGSVTANKRPASKTSRDSSPAPSAATPSPVVRGSVREGLAEKSLFGAAPLTRAQSLRAGSAGIEASPDGDGGAPARRSNTVRSQRRSQSGQQQQQPGLAISVPGPDQGLPMAAEAADNPFGSGANEMPRTSDNPFADN